VVNWLVYAASVATTVSLCFAIPKNCSSFIMELIIRRR
jgi:hypothetical protein